MLALHQACEAAVAARGEHDSDCDVQLFRAYIYAMAGRSWCPAVTRILERLSGKVPLRMLHSAVINADRYYQQALGQVAAVPDVELVATPPCQN